MRAHDREILKNIHRYCSLSLPSKNLYNKAQENFVVYIDSLVY